ncbi:MAG: hypothetical protein AAGF11_21915 [Myxococcota bacterium]
MPLSTRSGGRTRSLRPKLDDIKPPIDPVRASLDERARALELTPWGEGYLYRKREVERFDATILGDGTVVFEVDSSVDVVADGLCLIAICRPTKTLRRQLRGRRTARAVTTVAAILAEAAAGRMTFGTVKHYGVPTAGPIEGSELTEPPPYPVSRVLGRYGRLPAPVRAMNDFMERTFELRLAMAEHALRTQLEEASKQLSRTLALLGKRAKEAPAEYHAEIFALWVSLDAEPPRHADAVIDRSLDSDLDKTRRSAAAVGRRRILRSVRTHASVSSVSAFGEATLRAFNAREDVVVPFCPYEATPGCAASKVKGGAAGEGGAPLGSPEIRPAGR